MFTLPKNVLYPVDFSELSSAVWPAVAAMSQELGAPVTLLHALDVKRLDQAAVPGSLDASREQMRERLQRFPTPGLEIQNVQRELIQGPIAASIVGRAANMEAPLIMMAVGRHTRFRHLLRGSVSAAVLRDATCPVWIGTHVEEKRHAPTGVCSVVCAIGMGSHTPGILQVASEFGKQFRAALHVVHSVRGIDPRFPSRAADRAHAFLVDEAREKFPVHAQRAGVAAPLEIVEAVGLVNGIVGAVAQHRADLLIIGRGVMRGLFGRLGKNANELISRSPCPILSI